jgi:hypothetical protein
MVSVSLKPVPASSFFAASLRTWMTMFNDQLHSGSFFTTIMEAKASMLNMVKVFRI